MNDYLEFGRIASTHGLRGEFKVELWCDGFDFAAQFKTLYFGAENNAINVESCRGNGALAIIKIEGCDNIESAKAMVGKILRFARKDAVLAEGSFFQDDLIGLEVVDASTGETYGKITTIYQTGANDVYAIKDKKGIEKLFPAIPQVVKHINLEDGKMIITPIPGMFDDGNED